METKDVCNHEKKGLNNKKPMAIFNMQMRRNKFFFMKMSQT